MFLLLCLTFAHEEWSRLVGFTLSVFRRRRVLVGSSVTKLTASKKLSSGRAVRDVAAFVSRWVLEVRSGFSQSAATRRHIGYLSSSFNDPLPAPS